MPCCTENKAKCKRGFIWGKKILTTGAKKLFLRRQHWSRGLIDEKSAGGDVGTSEDFIWGEQPIPKP